MAWNPSLFAPLPTLTLQGYFWMSPGAEAASLRLPFTSGWVGHVAPWAGINKQEAVGPHSPRYRNPVKLSVSWLAVPQWPVGWVESTCTRFWRGMSCEWATATIWGPKWNSAHFDCNQAVASTAQKRNGDMLINTWAAQLFSATPRFPWTCLLCSPAKGKKSCLSWR